jgi:hypothetical protein
MFFKTGEFRLHSGAQNNFKIECDALDDDDWSTIAMLLAERLPGFSHVEGVPEGGLKLAEHLKPFATLGSVRQLLVDDVFTTGTSMTEHRELYAEKWGIPRSDIMGAVVFARGPHPTWVFPLFVMNEWQ